MRAHARTVIAALLTVALAIPSLLIAVPQKAFASTGLELVRDRVPSNTPQDPDIPHDIYFVLPVDAQQITPSDWIIIDLPAYTNVHGSLVFQGGFGTPTVAITGTRVKISNISVLPGTGLDIYGITANNPAIGVSQQVSIKIADDAGGVSVRNSAITLPITTGGNVEVSATVETVLSALTVSGYTAPAAFVTMTEGGSVVGTNQSSSTGFFNFPLTGLSPGPHTYSFVSTDQQNLGTSSSSISLFLLAGSLSTFTGLLLSPSITIDKTTIDPGATITVSGSAKPSSTINIFLEAPLRSYATTTDANGAWSFTVVSSETLSLTPGQYRIYTNVQDSLSDLSITSPTTNFTVNSPSSNNPPPACDISHGDLNCDGRTNLVDFSILLFHWQTNHRVADINSDGRVNLTDFSIMMFYFVR